MKLISIFFTASESILVIYHKDNTFAYIFQVLLYL